MNNNNSEVVLITGGSGFLGQHIIRELHRSKDLEISEIRIVDLKPYCNIHDYKERIPTKSFLKNICDKTSLHETFRGVTCVIHCAALISYQHPVNRDDLWNNNVKGTSNIVELCKEYDVSKLIFTSTAEVAFVPYIGATCISIIINQTETRAVPKSTRITGYAASKLEAESIVLKANGSETKNGLLLKTVALRPPLIYGEGDSGMMMSLLRISHWMGGVIPRVAGTGGKQQIVYAGNVAWSHICAVKALQKEEFQGTRTNISISGLPVFVTDDTTIADTTRICEKLTTSKNDNKPFIRQSWWSVPIILSFFIALIIEILSNITRIKLSVPPCALISYLGSFIFFNRLRASISLDYSPIYNEEDCLNLSAEYYRKAYRYIEKKECFK